MGRVMNDRDTTMSYLHFGQTNSLGRKCKKNNTENRIPIHITLKKNDFIAFSQFNYQTLLKVSDNTKFKI